MAIQNQRKIEQLIAALKAIAESGVTVDASDSRILAAVRATLSALSRTDLIDEDEGNRAVLRAEAVLDEARHWLVGEPSDRNQSGGRSLFALMLAEAREMVDSAISSNQLPDATVIARRVVYAHRDVPAVEEYREILEKEAHQYLCARKISRSE